MVKRWQFREDLYYRLNVVSVEMPPLRDRKDDIAALAASFIRKFAGELKKKIDGLSNRTRRRSMRRPTGRQHPRAREHDRGGRCSPHRGGAPRSDRSAARRSAEPVRRTGSGGGRQIPPTGIALEDIERHALVEALKMTNWVQKDAAELLSISPRVMNYKIKTLGIEFPGRPAPHPWRASVDQVAAASWLFTPTAFGWLLRYTASNWAALTCV